MRAMDLDTDDIIEQVDSEEEALISLESFDRASPEIWQEKCEYIKWYLNSFILLLVLIELYS
uniref:Uncharacterized protein n=1 Tax=Megaselia scalaris TaxID=36166 RepID=T1GC67_MEGSC